MKIAAIALASALAAFAQPAFAQSGGFNERDQGGQTQYGSGAQNQFRGFDRDRDSSGRDNWRRDDGGRGAGNDGWRHDEGMHGPMGMMGPRMRERFGEERGASFSFGNGRARMAVHCPANEPVQACVRAASQLLDKITSLRSSTAAAPDSSNTGSGVSETGPALRPGAGNGSGGSASSGSGAAEQDEQ